MSDIILVGTSRVCPKGAIMRQTLLILALILAGILSVLFAADSSATDYNARFIRNYPPGFHGMWYNAQRFFGTQKPGEIPAELYRWDLYMSGVTGLVFPFLPAPYAWDYGTGRTFNLPDYNRNYWN
jgi:hypothetical protein